MKTRLFSFTALLLVLCLAAFVSCKKDNTEDGVARPDELAYLQGHFAGFDEEGELTILAGWQLNEANPGELSMKADSYEAAVAIFKKIILPEANVVETDNSLIWHLTGEDGKSQGDAVLSKASGDKVAVLTLPASATLVSRVNFIPRSLWPENGEQEYREELDDFFFCNLVKISVNLTQNPGSIYCTGNHDSGYFLVIQEYDQETNTWGYLLRLPDNEYDLGYIINRPIFYKYAPTKATFDAVRKIYQDNKELFDKEMDKAGFSDRDAVVLIKSNKEGEYEQYKFDSGDHVLELKGLRQCLVYRFGYGAYNPNGTTQYSRFLTVQ